MSQAKVDKYKQEKANRKQTIARRKRNILIAKGCGVVVAAVAVVFIGRAAYKGYVDSIPAKNYDVTIADLSDYLQTLEADDTETE